MTISTVLGVLFAVIALPIGAIVTLGVWSRRGETRPDRNGERSVVVFLASPERTVDDVLDALTTALVREGVVVGEVSSNEWGGRELPCSTARRDDSLSIDPFEDEEEDDAKAWCVWAVDASSGGPPSRALLEKLGVAVASQPIFSSVRWRRREAHFVFRASNGRREDFDAPTDS